MNLSSLQDTPFLFCVPSTWTLGWWRRAATELLLKHVCNRWAKLVSRCTQVTQLWINFSDENFSCGPKQPATEWFPVVLPTPFQFKKEQGQLCTLFKSVLRPEEGTKALSSPQRAHYELLRLPQELNDGWSFCEDLVPCKAECADALRLGCLFLHCC